MESRNTFIRHSNVATLLIVDTQCLSPEVLKATNVIWRTYNFFFSFIIAYRGEIV